MTPSVAHSPSILLGDTLLRYPLDPLSGRLGFEMLPASLQSLTVERRKSLRGLPFIDAMPGKDAWPASVVEPLIQLKRVGDSYPGAFAQGHTLKNSPGVDAFQLVSQQREDVGEDLQITTTLRSKENHIAVHRLKWLSKEGVAEISCTFTNSDTRPVTLEMLSSFNLSGITPFAPDDAPGRLAVHRFRSGWSAEGRLETRSIEELHLERSWSGAGAFSERFGQVGTMPVRRWFPFVAIEDTAAGVVWAAQVAWAGSWQLEVFRQHDDVTLSGGLADREFGHWMLTLQPGESITTPPAYLCCVHGDLDQACDRLSSVQNRALQNVPEVEQSLPIVFNEWCTTWGDPRHDRMIAIAQKLHGTPVKYLVIDAGWYKGERGDWGNGHGDWIPSRKLFPYGLESTAQAIRDQGLIPGLWFEMETVGDASTAYTKEDLLLQRDRAPITVRNRRFWDLSNERAIAYLNERVASRLASCGFGYLKVDYNETAGLGADHPCSLGEGLRQQVLGTYAFFESLRKRIPGLVIENCSSGGHRLEPSMLGRTAMSSFSDAHELVEIPIIAANLHRLMLPRQSQIWAVLHPSDSQRRLTYSLAATFLGRMCLSGDVIGLSAPQWKLVCESMELYRLTAGIIKSGQSRQFGQLGKSWRHPEGWQALRRVSENRTQALVVVHAFENAPSLVHLPLPDEGRWEVVGHFGEKGLGRGETFTGTLSVNLPGDFSALVLLLNKLAD